MALSEFMLLAGTANPTLAEDISNALGTKVGRARVGVFSDHEIRVEIHENIRGRDVFLVQPTCYPANKTLMELLIMTDACKRASAGRLTAVIPYYGYARQDRKVASRAPITAKLVADLLSTAGVSRILTMELHAGQIQGFFDVPVDNLYASSLLVNEIQKSVGDEDLVIVSPDAGGVERARHFAKQLNGTLAIIDKRRDGPNVAEVMHIIGDVRNRTAVLVDDMIDTAGTITKAAAATIEHGATRVIAAGTHPVLSGPAVKRIADSPLEKLIVTDTIPLQPAAKELDKIHVVSVAPLFAEAIDAIHNNASVSRLFD
jgi:ribose-phosphate pyrophosphokinase